MFWREQSRRRALASTPMEHPFRGAKRLLAPKARADLVQGVHRRGEHSEPAIYYKFLMDQPKLCRIPEQQVVFHYG